MPSTTRAISKGPASTGRNPSIDFTKGESACSAAGAIFWTYSQSAEPGDLDLHISGTHFISSFSIRAWRLFPSYSGDHRPSDGPLMLLPYCISVQLKTSRHMTCPTL